MSQPDELRAEADALVQQQREHRGWVKTKDLEGKACRLLGEYHSTPESEDRARRIVQLRRQAARLDGS